MQIQKDVKGKPRGRSRTKKGTPSACRLTALEVIRGQGGGSSRLDGAKADVFGGRILGLIYVE